MFEYGIEKSGMMVSIIIDRVTLMYLYEPMKESYAILVVESYSASHRIKERGLKVRMK